MDSNENISQQIDSYLSGEMNATDRLAFEKKVELDPSLKEELLLEQTVKNALIDDALMNWNNSIKSEFKAEKKRRLINKILILTSAVLLIGVSIITFINVSKPETVIEKQFDEKENVTQKKEADNTEGIEEEQSKEEKTETINIIQKENSPQDLKKVAEKDTTTLEVEKPKNESLEKPFLVDTIISIDKVDTKAEKVIKTPTDPCLGIELEAKITSNPTCEGEDKGSIHVDRVTAGTKPYEYKVGGSEWSKTPKFSNLYTGEYLVAVRDVNNCELRKEELITVEEKYCFTPEDGFNPDLETWEYRGNWLEPVKITIRNRSGRVVLETMVSDVFVWDGTDSQGQRLSSGLYIYTIEAEKLIQGSVTVIY